MKIGIVAVNDQVSAHFGQSEGLYVYTKNEDTYELEIKQVKPHQEGSFPQMVFHEHVDVLICGGLGLKAKQKFDGFGIKVIAGVSGDIDTVFHKYLHDELESNDSFCEGHHHHE